MWHVTSYGFTLPLPTLSHLGHTVSVPVLPTYQQVPDY
jgi:hypothetical protein